MTSTVAPAYYQTQSEEFWEKSLEEKGSDTKKRKAEFAALWSAVDAIMQHNPSYYENPTLKYDRKKPCEETGKQHQTEPGDQQTQQQPNHHTPHQSTQSQTSG